MKYEEFMSLAPDTWLRIEMNGRQATAKASVAKDAHFNTVDRCLALSQEQVGLRTREEWAEFLFKGECFRMATQEEIQRLEGDSK